MENEEQNDFRLEGTGFAYTLSLINGKYKMPILYCLSKHEVVRYNEMKRYLGKVTFKTLTDSLKALEEDGLVNRKEYPQVPPKVEYSLTEKGRSLILCLRLCVHGEKNTGNKTYRNLHKNTSRSKYRKLSCLYFC